MFRSCLSISRTSTPCFADDAPRRRPRARHPPRARPSRGSPSSRPSRLINPGRRNHVRSQGSRLHISLLYSHSGFAALKHCRSLGYRNFEMMIFPPHCWPADMTPKQKREIGKWLDGEGCRITSFCYPCSTTIRTPSAASCGATRSIATRRRSSSRPTGVAPMSAPSRPGQQPDRSPCEMDARLVCRGHEGDRPLRQRLGRGHHPGERPLHLPANGEGHAGRRQRYRAGVASTSTSAIPPSSRRTCPRPSSCSASGSRTCIFRTRPSPSSSTTSSA